MAFEIQDAPKDVRSLGRNLDAITKARPAGATLS